MTKLSYIDGVGEKKSLVINDEPSGKAGSPEVKASEENYEQRSHKKRKKQSYSVTDDTERYVIQAACFQCIACINTISLVF